MVRKIKLRKKDCPNKELWDLKKEEDKCTAEVDEIYEGMYRREFKTDEVIYRILPEKDIKEELKELNITYNKYVKNITKIRNRIDKTKEGIRYDKSREKLKQFWKEELTTHKFKDKISKEIIQNIKIFKSTKKTLDRILDIKESYEILIFLKEFVRRYKGKKSYGRLILTNKKWKSKFYGVAKYLI